MVFLLFAVGLVCIIWGGDRLVDSAVWIAEVSGVPKFIIGATVVSLATTLPEIVVSVIAASKGELEMASGNAIGSVTANTAMILSLSVIFMPASIDRRRYLPKSLIFLGSVVLLFLLSVSGRLNLFGSAVLCVMLIIFICENISSAKSESGRAEEKRQRVSSGLLLHNVMCFVLGGAGIVLGSRLLVDNGTVIAREILHIDERIISLTLVAVGTSLPELVTAVTAIVKRQGSLSVGNIIGANIIDMLLILPLCSLVCGGELSISPATLFIDLPFSFVVAVAALVPALIGGRFYKIQGIISLLLYCGYLAVLFFVP